MKPVKHRNTSNSYKGLYDADLLTVARGFFIYKLVIAFCTMTSIHFALAFIGLSPALAPFNVLSYMVVGGALAVGFCWQEYCKLLDAKKRHINSLYR
jgi:hypothetical protein